VLDKITAAHTKARKRGWALRKADHPNEGKNWTLSHDGAETNYATIDEVLAKLERVKPAKIARQ
jgi:hypothetical protein